MARLPRPTRPLLWIASSRDDLREFPDDVQDQFGYELFLAQTGEHPPSAKPFKGVGSGVVELIENHDGDTYRAVYTVRLATAVYVLHAFKKKSKQGIKTPPRDVGLIKKRLKVAEDHDADERNKEGRK
jgi:phage-related protein